MRRQERSYGKTYCASRAGDPCRPRFWSGFMGNCALVSDELRLR
jgi:hypothetical protein